MLTFDSQDGKPPASPRQRDHARDHGQADRAILFDTLISNATQKGGTAQ